MRALVVGIGAPITAEQAAVIEAQVNKLLGLECIVIANCTALLEVEHDAQLLTP